MVSSNQILVKNIRSKKRKKRRCPALSGRPQLRGVCSRVFTRSPKKPNSAVRKVAKIKLSTLRTVEVYLPGEAQKLRQYASVLIRGGRTPDLPGTKYKAIRGVYDFESVAGRKTARSKYGVKLSDKK